MRRKARAGFGKGHRRPHGDLAGGAGCPLSEERPGLVCKKIVKSNLAVASPKTYRVQLDLLLSQSIPAIRPNRL